MVELADAQDLGSCAARRVGSTPTTRTKKHVGSFRTGVLFLIMVTLLNFQTALTAALYSISRNCTALGAPVSG